MQHTTALLLPKAPSKCLNTARSPCPKPSSFGALEMNWPEPNTWVMAVSAPQISVSSLRTFWDPWWNSRSSDELPQEFSIIGLPALTWPPKALTLN